MSFEPPKQWTPDDDLNDGHPNIGMAKTHHSFHLTQRITNTKPEKDGYVVVEFYNGTKRLTQTQIPEPMAELNNELTKKPRRLLLTGQDTPDGLASTLQMILHAEDLEIIRNHFASEDVEIPSLEELSEVTDPSSILVCWPIGNYVRPNRDRKFLGDAQAEVEDQMAFILTTGPEDQGVRALKHLLGD